MSELRVTYIRCSTVLLQCGDKAVLTDPWFRLRMWFLPCLRWPGRRPDQLPRLDVVLTSHLHPDHYDPKAMQVLAPPRALFPPDSLRRLEGVGPGWEELAPWETTRIADLDICAVPAPHTGPPPDEVAWVLGFPGFGAVYFGGDGKLDRETLRRVRSEHGPIRLALLPVGGTRIFGKKTTMSPGDAEEAADLLEAERIIPIHQGGDWPALPPASLHPGRARHLARRFATRGEAERVFVLGCGDSVTLR
jgi:L-ascorbate metabolism protein UlaG (beta-lactamase superfamily)